MNLLATMMLSAAVTQQDCQYAVGYGLQIFKFVDGSWVNVVNGSFVQPGVPIRFHGWVSVGAGGCDACCAEISFLLTTSQGVCGPGPTYNWQRIGTMKPLSAGELWEWTSPTYVPETYIVSGYFLIENVQSAGQTHTHAPSQHCFVPCNGDVSGDLAVNVNDLLAVINNWIAPSSSCGDANNDGAINLQDIIIVISNWGSCY